MCRVCVCVLCVPCELLFDLQLQRRRHWSRQGAWHSGQSTPNRASPFCALSAAVVALCRYNLTVNLHDKVAATSTATTSTTTTIQQLKLTLNCAPEMCSETVFKVLRVVQVVAAF